MTPEQRLRANDLLFSAARNNSVASWEALFLLLYPIGVRSLHGRLSHANDDDDIVQEAFLRLMSVSLRYRKEADAVSFFLAVLRRVASEHLKRLGRRGSFRMPLSLDSHQENANPHCSGKAASPEEAAANAEFRHILQRRIAELPGPLSEAVRLRFYEGLDTAAAARQADCSKDALRQRLSRAISALRGCMSKDEDGGTQETLGA